MGFPYIDTLHVKNKLLADLGPLYPDGVYVIRTGERDMKLTFGRLFPAVYITRQIFSSTEAGGSSRVLRQTFDTYLELVAVARRYEDGRLEGETERRALCSAVVDSLHGFTIPGTDLALDLAEYADGDPADTVNYSIFKFHTRTLYMKEVTP